MARCGMGAFTVLLVAEGADHGQVIVAGEQALES
jgi:hypothetical protein